MSQAPGSLHLRLLAALFATCSPAHLQCGRTPKMCLRCGRTQEAGPTGSGSCLLLTLFSSRHRQAHLWVEENRLQLTYTLRVRWGN